MERYESESPVYFADDGDGDGRGGVESGGEELPFGNGEWGLVRELERVQEQLRDVLLEQQKGTR